MSAHVHSLVQCGVEADMSREHLQTTCPALVQVQISMLTGRQAEEARAGIDMLARCRENVEQVRKRPANLA